MPRPGQVKPPAGERLPDRIAVGLLTVTFPPELVDRVVAETGRVQRRSRLLPARVVVYYVLAMCLFFGQGYEEVARLLTEGLAYARRWKAPRSMCPTAWPTWVTSAGRARRAGRAQVPSRRCGWPGWASAARTRSSPRRWGRWRCMRPSWPGGCWVTCAPGCC